MKFESLVARTRDLGIEHVATGHYARKDVDPVTGRHRLLKGRDERKDQSYFLFGLTQEQLASALFPVGGLEKNEVRRLAAERGLPTDDKAESRRSASSPTTTTRLRERHAPRRTARVRSWIAPDASSAIIKASIGLRWAAKGTRRAARISLCIVVGAVVRTVVAGRRQTGDGEVTARDVNWLSIANHRPGRSWGVKVAIGTLRQAPRFAPNRWADRGASSMHRSAPSHPSGGGLLRPRVCLGGGWIE